jgi:hypothetical protein
MNLKIWNLKHFDTKKTLNQTNRFCKSGDCDANSNFRRNIKGL